MRGTWLVLDGGEGAGKSTVCRRAKVILEGSGRYVISTREPGGSPFAEKIRTLILSNDAAHADAETLFGLFWSARRDHLVTTIKPAFENGALVLCDRFDSSTFAYQIAAQEQRQLTDLFWRMRTHYLGDISPDLYVIFDIDPRIGLSRVERRKADERNHLDARDLDFHNRVRAGFLEFAGSVIHTVIDASKGHEEVLADFMKINILGR